MPEVQVTQVDFDRAAIQTEILEERHRQAVIEHGGDTAAFDEANTMNDWVAYIVAYAGRASAKVTRNQLESDAYAGTQSPVRDKDRFRTNLIKVGALVLAALEAEDA